MHDTHIAIIERAKCSNEVPHGAKDSSEMLHPLRLPLVEMHHEGDRHAVVFSYQRNTTLPLWGLGTIERLFLRELVLVPYWKLAIESVGVTSVDQFSYCLTKLPLGGTLIKPFSSLFFHWIAWHRWYRTLSVGIGTPS